MKAAKTSQYLALLFAAVALGIFSAPAEACIWTGGWLDPNNPFFEDYLDEGQIIFRGRPLEIRSPELDAPTTYDGPNEDIENGFEVTFAVLATYRGEKRESWTAFQTGSVFRESLDLQAFKNEIGDDLLVMLSEPDKHSRQFTQLPLITLGECGELLMRRFDLMEPALREKGLIH